MSTTVRSSPRLTQAGVAGRFARSLDSQVGVAQRRLECREQGVYATRGGREQVEILRRSLDNPASHERRASGEREIFSLREIGHDAGDRLLKFAQHGSWSPRFSSTKPAHASRTRAGR